MVALLNQELDVKYEDSDELLKKQAEDGASRNQQRVLLEEQEREEIVNQIRALEQLESIDIAPQNKTTCHIDFKTGVVSSDDVTGFEDELSIAAIIDLVERGAISEEQLESFLGDACTSIAASSARDKVNAKKHSAHIVELLQILEVSSGIGNKNTDLQNSLRGLQEKLVVANKSVNLEAFQKVVHATDLQEILKQAIKVATIEPQNLRAVNEVVQNLAKDIQKLSNEQMKIDVKVVQNQAIKETSQKTEDRPNLEAKQQTQTVLRESFKQLEKSFNATKQQLSKETDPVKLQQGKEALKEISNQAKEIKQAYSDVQNAKPAEVKMQIQQAQRLVENVAVTNKPNLVKNAIQNQRLDLQEQQKFDPKPETQTKLKALESVEKMVEPKIKVMDKAEAPKNVITPDPKVFKEPKLEAELKDRGLKIKEKIEKEPQMLTGGGRGPQKEPQKEPQMLTGGGRGPAKVPKDIKSPTIEEDITERIGREPTRPPTRPNEIHICAGGDCCKTSVAEKVSKDPTGDKVAAQRIEQSVDISNLMAA